MRKALGYMVEFFKPLVSYTMVPPSRAFPRRHAISLCAPYKPPDGRIATVLAIEDRVGKPSCN
jgi:hypothetical protein